MNKNAIDNCMAYFNSLIDTNFAEKYLYSFISESGESVKPHEKK